ncbi:unnamed protein product [Sphenostylis stenocarpa]|uniref:TLC domain-containing protein n=1 Tax=Sphenostylis stenocarpa TaxID=92480 RepID=A0AA86SU15_9FABA|nr:unnamed protein product [Sphenostylis stenocarpa]
MTDLDAYKVSVGYFISDLGTILWFFPSLGGYEYVIHHLLSLVAVAYSMCSGEGQLYTFMVLISETTTPGINLRWYLDVAGMKKSKAYLINGIVIFISWLVARILLFFYMFYHVYLHFDQAEIPSHAPSCTQPFCTFASCVGSMHYSSLIRSP